MSELGKLQTEQGERATYDAASQCSRCGYCEQACPTYVVTGREAFSGRGRNQLVRMMLEGRMDDPASAGEALETCLLCGACTSACYAHVPTAELVLEGRRRLRGEEARWPANMLGRLLAERPAAFARLLKLAHALKRLGLSRLAASSGLLRLLGLGALETAERQVAEAPMEFLAERLRRAPALQDPRGAAWAYFAPCGPNYLLPRVGLATVRMLQAARGRGVFLDNPCCGLLEYNYGSVERARELARKNIQNCERIYSETGKSPEGDFPVIGDCSSCVAHLKSYPQLFLGDAAWRARAERFARSVRDAIETLPDGPGQDGRVAPGGWPEVVTWHDSCRARNGQGLVEPPRAWMRRCAGAAFVELPEPGWCCGGAGAFAFLHPGLSDEVLRRKIAHIASVQARLVATSSTSCLLQLAHGLKKYYPECRVVHVTELAAEGVNAN